MPTIYDVAVVGAGPAGLGACCAAAAKGLSVALIERRKRLSPITRACSEGLLYEEPYNGEAIRVDREQGNIVFEPSGMTLRYSGPIREVPYFANISRRGRRMTMIRDDRKPIHLVFDKARYLEENLADAIQRGVRFFPDRTVVDLNLQRDAVTVHTDKQDFSARFVVAADGHNSLCARIAGFDRERLFYGTLTAACWHIEGPEPGEQGHLHLLEGADDPTIFCMCPRVVEGQWSVIISGFRLVPDYDKRFEQVTRHSVLAPLFAPRVHVLRRLACVLNLYSPLENPCTDSLYIIGDGAWFGQTSNSHAALTGFQAAECIGSALEGTCTRQDAAERYRQWWRQRFYDGWRPPGVNIFEHLTADEIDELFSLLPPEIPGSLEPGKAQRLTAALFQNLMPTLREKHPRLLQRIAAVQQQPPETVRAERQKQGIAVRSLSRSGDTEQGVP